MSLPDTRSAREQIFGALRGIPPVAASEPDLAPYLDGPYAGGSRGERIAPATLVEPFARAARGWRAEVVQVSSADWPAAVHEALLRRGCAKVAVGAAPALDDAADAGLDAALAGLNVVRFDRPIEQWKRELFDTVDAAVTSAAAAIADTGTLLLLPGPHEPRTLSLVPPVHVAVLRASALYASLPAALRAISPQAAMPTNLVLVSGPSKTADIQQVLAYGAHGPKELVIVLVDDLDAMPKAAA